MVRRLTLLALGLFLFGCSDKSSDPDTEPVPQTQTQPDDDDLRLLEPEELDKPEEEETPYYRWMKTISSLDASICKKAPRADLDEFSRCSIAMAAERCERADWCWIDCTDKNMGVNVGGGCFHVCYYSSRTIDPPGQGMYSECKPKRVRK